MFTVKFRLKRWVAKWETRVFQTEAALKAWLQTNSNLDYQLVG